MPEERGSTDQLERVHVLLTRMLAELDRVCTELDIPYVVYGGTAIGAVRHKGFIPWDDDVDVLMTRPDYERFLAEAPAVLGGQYRLDNTRTVPEFPFMFTKLVLRGTLFIPEFARDSAYRMPLSADILPVDNVPDNPLAFRLMSARTWLWGRLLFLQGTPRPYLVDAGTLQRVLVHGASGLAHQVLRLLGVTPRSLQRRWERAARRYDGRRTAAMADFSMRDPQNWIVTHDELYPARRVPFEDITVALARQYDVLLRRGYGDYMTPPPLAKRRNHVSCIVDLGPYADESR